MTNARVREALTAGANVKDKGPHVADGVLTVTPDAPEVAEWRSKCPLDCGGPSSSYLDDDDEGPKPHELYGKFTWKIENFSEISKRELRSNVFDVGNYKWYILVYPQGCDVCNHLSLFLCVADYDKLLPGWSHFAQFTIAVVNKDPKKSKYSDTLHRFCKKEHDWGWKKFMELSKVLDGFTVAGTLVIKAQVQVILDKPSRPFRCLDPQYRRELVRVYLTNVEAICRRVCEEKRVKMAWVRDNLAKFRDFWNGLSPEQQKSLMTERGDVILKGIVKQFFNEKEVTSTLVMDALLSGCKQIEEHSRLAEEGKSPDGAPCVIINAEKNIFTFGWGILDLLEGCTKEFLPAIKDDKLVQGADGLGLRSGQDGDEYRRDSIERDEKRLAELGRRSVEMFVIAHLFSEQLEIAFREAEALKKQDQLIAEEEEAERREESRLQAKAVADREKRAKKKERKKQKEADKAKKEAEELERKQAAEEEERKRQESLAAAAAAAQQAAPSSPRPAPALAPVAEPSPGRKTPVSKRANKKLLQQQQQQQQQASALSASANATSSSAPSRAPGAAAPQVVPNGPAAVASTRSASPTPAASASSTAPAAHTPASPSVQAPADKPQSQPLPNGRAAPAASSHHPTTTPSHHPSTSTSLSPEVPSDWPPASQAGGSAATPPAGHSDHRPPLSSQQPNHTNHMAASSSAAAAGPPTSALTTAAVRALPQTGKPFLDAATGVTAHRPSSARSSSSSGSSSAASQSTTNNTSTNPPASSTGMPKAWVTAARGGAAREPGRPRADASAAAAAASEVCTTSGAAGEDGSSRDSSQERVASEEIIRALQDRVMFLEQELAAKDSEVLALRAQVADLEGQVQRQKEPEAGSSSQAAAGGQQQRTGHHGEDRRPPGRTISHTRMGSGHSNNAADFGPSSSEVQRSVSMDSLPLPHSHLPSPSTNMASHVAGLLTGNGPASHPTAATAASAGPAAPVQSWAATADNYSREFPPLQAAADNPQPSRAAAGGNGGGGGGAAAAAAAATSTGAGGAPSTAAPTAATAATAAVVAPPPAGAPAPAATDTSDKADLASASGLVSGAVSPTPTASLPGDLPSTQDQAQEAPARDMPASTVRSSAAMPLLASSSTSDLPSKAPGASTLLTPAVIPVSQLMSQTSNPGPCPLSVSALSTSAAPLLPLVNPSLPPLRRGPMTFSTDITTASSASSSPQTLASSPAGPPSSAAASPAVASATGRTSLTIRAAPPPSIPLSVQHSTPPDHASSLSAHGSSLTQPGSPVTPQLLGSATPASPHAGAAPPPVPAPAPDTSSALLRAQSMPSHLEQRKDSFPGVVLGDHANGRHTPPGSIPVSSGQTVIPTTAGHSRPRPAGMDLSNLSSGSTTPAGTPFVPASSALPHQNGVASLSLHSMGSTPAADYSKSESSTPSYRNAAATGVAGPPLSGQPQLPATLPTSAAPSASIPPPPPPVASTAGNMPLPNNLPSGAKNGEDRVGVAGTSAGSAAAPRGFGPPPSRFGLGQQGQPGPGQVPGMSFASIHSKVGPVMGQRPRHISPSEANPGLDDFAHMNLITDLLTD